MGEYILPLSITSPTIEGVEISATQKTVLLGITYSPDKLELKASQFKANSIAEGDGTGYTGLIDGLGSGLHFHSNWSAPVKNPAPMVQSGKNWETLHRDSPPEVTSSILHQSIVRSNPSPTSASLYWKVQLVP